jgi:hypothetical protein
MDARHEAGHDVEWMRGEEPYAALLLGCTSAE